jgi:hypothetical protein
MNNPSRISSIPTIATSAPPSLMEQFLALEKRVTELGSSIDPTFPSHFENLQRQVADLTNRVTPILNKQITTVTESVNILTKDFAELKTITLECLSQLNTKVSESPQSSSSAPLTLSVPPTPISASLTPSVTPSVTPSAPQSSIVPPTPVATTPHQLSRRVMRPPSPEDDMPTRRVSNNSFNFGDSEEEPIVSMHVTDASPSIANGAQTWEYDDTTENFASPAPPIAQTRPKKTASSRGGRLKKAT